MGKVWVSSDFHFGHNKSFLYNPRGFNDIETHDETIIDSWNMMVKPQDDVYTLGDYFLNNNDNGIKKMSRLNGKFHIIWGNHDTDNRKKIIGLLPNVIEICGYSTILKYKKYHFYLSHYPTICSNHDFDKPLKARAINLCGHTHTKNKFLDWNLGTIYHCELDAHYNLPVNIENIIIDIKEKIHE